MANSTVSAIGEIIASQGGELTATTIAPAIKQLVGSIGSGSSGGAAGYDYGSTITDIVHEQTINVIEDPDWPDYPGSFISVDMKASAGIDFVSSGDIKANVTCVLDGVEYPAAAVRDTYEAITNSIAIYADHNIGNSTMPIAYIQQAYGDDKGTIAILDTEAIGLGEHTIRVYHKAESAAFEQPFIEFLRDALEGAKGYRCVDSELDIVAEQTIEVLEGSNDATVDVERVIEQIYGLALDGDVYMTCLIDGVEYPAVATIVTSGGTQIRETQIRFAGQSVPPHPLIAKINYENLRYVLNVLNTEALEVGEHTIRIFYVEKTADFEQWFIDELRSALGLNP